MRPYYEHAGITIYHGDCREILPRVQRLSVVTDPPYGVTGHAWDVPVEPTAWMHGDMAVCTATEPYATGVINASLLPFQFDCVWLKSKASNAFNASRMPMRRHERVLVFGSYEYVPQMKPRTKEQLARLDHKQRIKYPNVHPDSVLEFDSVNNQSVEFSHPSQKPLELMDYLVKTFTKGSILDPFMGSGTTLIAAKNLGRNAIGIEIEEKYCEIAAKRLSQEVMQFSEVEA